MRHAIPISFCRQLSPRRSTRAAIESSLKLHVDHVQVSVRREWHLWGVRIMSFQDFQNRPCAYPGKYYEVHKKMEQVEQLSEKKISHFHKTPKDQA